MESTNLTTIPQPANTGLATLDPAIMAKLVINGDLRGLDETQRVAFYNFRCQQAGLRPEAKPFDLLVLNGKMILYANAGCTQQLTAIHALSHQITRNEVLNGCNVVAVRVTGKDGRSTENIGAVNIDGLKGEPLCNAMMKATTKAIRRAVLAHCGLGMLDETEADSIPGAQKAEWQAPATVQDAAADTEEYAPATEPTVLLGSPFKTKYETVEEVERVLEDAKDIKDIANLYYINAELVETSASLRTKFTEAKNFYYGRQHTSMAQ